jgi:hypothetical protein
MSDPWGNTKDRAYTIIYSFENILMCRVISVNSIYIYRKSGIEKSIQRQ